MEPSQLSDTPTISKEQKEDLLWRMAKKRASFKRSFISYLAVNTFLVAIWFLTSGEESYFWPIWPILGWGFGMAMQYVDAYHTDKIFSAEKEFQKLKNKQQ